MSQKVVGVGTSGLPTPVRKFLGGRIVAGLIVLCVPVLFYSGLITVDFQNGRPRIHFNQTRVAEVKEQAADAIEELSGEDKGFAAETSEAIQSFVSEHKPAFGSEPQPQPGNGIAGELTKSFGSFQNNLSAEQPEQQSGFQLFGSEAKPNDERKGPLSSLKDRFNTRR